MSTTHTPFSTVAETFSDALVEVLAEASHVTRVSTEAYLKGLDAVVEQQKHAREESRQWLSEMTSIQSHLVQRVAPGDSSVSDRYATAAVQSIEATEGTVATIAPSTTTTPARRTAKRNQATTPPRARRKASTPAATSTPARASVAGMTSDRYDALNAAEVIERLPEFSQHHLLEIDAYEQGHQARQTVLERIGTLRGPEPISGYDELTVLEVHAQLTAGDHARATAVRDYERAHKKRDGVLQAAQARIEKA